MRNCLICGIELEWKNCKDCEGEGGRWENDEFILCVACEGEEGGLECTNCNNKNKEE